MFYRLTAIFMLLSAIPLDTATGRASWNEPSDTVRCDSHDREFVRCEAKGWRDARVAMQVSREPCERGRNWGVDRGSLWVDRGCRALFERVGGSRRGLSDDSRRCIWAQKGCRATYSTVPSYR